MSPETVISCEGVRVTYGAHEALHPTTLDFSAGSVTALIGPSGCGKSTFLRSMNLMNREVRDCVVEGRILYHGRDVNTSDVDVYALRHRVGMVFQQPSPFPKSVYDNVAFALRRHGVTDRDQLDALVRRSLVAAALWDEVKDRLSSSALSLSGGQQQRLCIARTLALEPDVVLMDEPCSALDPIATFTIEDTIREMASRGICVVVVTHNMEQAARISDGCAFFLLGEMVESGPTPELFSRPGDRRLEDYLTGRFG